MAWMASLEIEAHEALLHWLVADDVILCVTDFVSAPPTEISPDCIGIGVQDPEVGLRDSSRPEPGTGIVEEPKTESMIPMFLEDVDGENLARGASAIVASEAV